MALAARLLGIGAAVVVALAATGCAAAINYDQPDGPVALGGFARPRGTTDRLRVVTFNVKFGEHVEALEALFSAPGSLHDPDILVLQEVDERAVETVARTLELNFVYVPSAIHPSTRRDFGVAVLTPWPIAGARKVPLPHPHRFRGLMRAAAAATVDTPLGVVRVYGVHLETPWGAPRHARWEQALALAADAKRWIGPAIVAGDFNGADAIRPLTRAGFRWLTRRVGRTALLFSVDHVVTRGLCSVGADATGAVAGLGDISDHRPVWAVVSPCAAQ